MARFRVPEGWGWDEELCGFILMDDPDGPLVRPPDFDATNKWEAFNGTTRMFYCGGREAFAALGVEVR